MRNDQLETVEYSSSAGLEIKEDVALAQRARGDPQAFAELYQRHMKQIYHYHLIRTGSVDDAQDLTSQTFMAALESIGSYCGQGSFGGWLFGIASHKVADHYRRRRPDIPLENAEALDHPDPSPEDLATTHLQLAQVATALRTLVPEQAEALALRVFGGLSASQVGQIMGKSEAAAKMLVHRGLRKLRGELIPIAEV